jgi:SAM-dependent methyltransferase
MEQLPASRLRAAESVVLARALARQAGSHGLYIGMTDRLAKGLPRMGCWTRLRWTTTELDGAVRARLNESLPFCDDAFRVVVLSHVLEWTPHAAQLLDEAARVLAPEGLLVVTGFHPFSGWLPWLLCRRRPRPMLVAPGWLRQRLTRQEVKPTALHRCGAPLPWLDGGATPSWLGGGFVLVARKEQTAVMALKPQARRQAASSRHGAWVPGTHRECA